MVQSSRFRRFLAIPVIFLGVTLSATHAASPSVDDFLAFSGVDDIALSPDGKYLAAVQDTAKDGNVRAFMIYRIEGGKLTLHAGSKFTNTTASNLTWANENRVLVTLQKYDPKTGSSFYYKDGGLTMRWEPPQVLALDADLKNSVFLLAKEHKFKDTVNRSQILHMMDNDREHVLMAVSTTDRNASFDVFKVNVYDGSAKLVQKGNTYTQGWMVDQDANIRLRIDVRNYWTNVNARVASDGEWFEIGRYGYKEIPDINPIAFSADPNILYVAAPKDDDRLAIFEYRIRERALGQMLFSHPKVDMAGGIHTLSDNGLVGFRYVVHKPHGKYLDERYKTFETKLEAAFGAENFARPISITRDHKLMIILVSGPREPGSYYLFDAVTNKAQLIGVKSGELQPGQLGVMKPVVYKARDGVEINAYLTMPPGNPPRPPLVVMPHGGPEARDYLTWDRLAQFVATRGYAVLQPNFRGSDGFGKKFAEAGYKQWGLKMQDDITDGVRHVVSEGLVDSGRICIVGWSYGGYAALAGAAFTPELYKCAVSVNGVGDLSHFVRWRQDRNFGHEYWKKSIGDPGDSTDRARMESRSPVNAVDRIVVPVLLFAGEEDGIVPVLQSREMAAALKKAGKPHTYIEFENEGHSFDSTKNYGRLLTELETFLARHLRKSSQNAAAAQ